MSTSDDSTRKNATESTHRDYILGVRIVECRSSGRDDATYRVETPNDGHVTFDDRSLAELYVDIYFDVNGFTEAGTGDRGVPPTIIQAGRDTLVAYLLTRPDTDVHWIASFYGEKPEKVERYVNRVRKRATQIREGARERGMT